MMKKLRALCQMALPMWPTIIAFNTFAFLFAGGLALITESRWGAMADMFFAGASLAMAFSNWNHMRMRAAFDSANAAFEHMAEMNKALIQGKFQMMVIGPVDDDDAPLSPKNLN